MTMNCLATPTQRTGEPEAPARASVSERFRRLKWNEVVWSGDFVADERLGFELWEASGVFRAGSFARPIHIIVLGFPFRQPGDRLKVGGPSPMTNDQPTDWWKGSPARRFAPWLSNNEVQALKRSSLRAIHNRFDVSEECRQ
jgi:hypothetical protein